MNGFGSARANVAVFLAVLLPGCVMGPKALQLSRVRYNKVIQETTNEQLLLNLVRLQYRESPLFLDVGSVSAQFQFAENGNVNATLNEGPNPINPDSLGLGASVGYQEKPTITFAPLQGREFVSQLLSPLSLDDILLLTYSGWRVDRVLRLTVQTMNGLANAPRASGPTPPDAPRYEAFSRVAYLLCELQKKGLLQIGYELREEDTGLTVPLQTGSLSDILNARSQGYCVRIDPSTNSLMLTASSRVPVWRIPETAIDGPEVTEIVRLLGLKPGERSYEICLSIGGQPTPFAKPGERTQVNIATRSLLGTLFYVSQAIEVPECHRQAGVVTTTYTPDGDRFDWTQVTGDLIRIHAQRVRPSRAAVAVHHRDCWFYVDDADLTSKSTLGLLSQLFALQAGAAEAAAPVLTLPLGG